MQKILVFDVRKLKEIQHCLYYKRHLAHGTVGHNLLMLAAETFEVLGFGLNESNLLTFMDINITGENTLSATVTVEVSDDWLLSE